MALSITNSESGECNLRLRSMCGTGAREVIYVCAGGSTVRKLLRGVVPKVGGKTGK